MALGRFAVLRWIDGIVKEMKLKRTERVLRIDGCEGEVCASARELEADEACGELESARAAQARDSGGEERLSGGEDGVRRVSEVAHAVGVEAEIFCSDDVEDVHKEIEMVALAFEGEIFD
jgi:hypothetical protein